MRKILHILVLLILLISCREPDKPKMIQESESYSFINDFLIDSIKTVDLFAIETIRFWNLNLHPNGPPQGAPYYISFDNKLFDSLLKYDIIKPSDIESIISQISQKEEFVWDSSKINLRTFSLKYIDNLKTGNSTDGPWDKIHKTYLSRQFIILSRPIFINGPDTILISVNRMCNGLCGNGQFVVIKKVKNKWTIIYNTFTWTS